MEPIKVGIVEDQYLFRQGVKSLFNEAPYKIDVVFESPDGYTVIDRLDQSENIPNVMLVDLTLPPNGKEEFNGWRVIEALKQQYPEMKTIVLSVHEDEYLIAKLIEEGASAYLVKDSDPQELYDAILNVYQRGSYINAQALKAVQGKLQGKVKTPKVHEELTRREVEVLELVCQQMTTEEIANKLFISGKTVNGHRNNLLQKTGSRNVTGLVMYAIKHQLVALI